FDNGLDDQVAVLELLKLRGGLHARVDRIEIRLAELALGDLALQQVAVEAEGIFDGFGAGIVQQHLLTTAGEQLGDTTAHRAGTDNTNPVEHTQAPRLLCSAMRNRISFKSEVRLNPALLECKPGRRYDHI